MLSVGSPAAWAFWAALSLLAYVYAGYPLVAWARGRVRPRHSVRAPIEPTVTVVVVAHDEGHRIEARIENLLASDYPQARLAIVIGSDGSSDDTVERAARYGGRGVTVRGFTRRRGKAAMLNDLVPAAGGEIVVFADARQRFERGAIRALVENFADPQVGAVSGELILSGPNGSGPGFYWKYEKFIRASESRSGSTVGATGAIYAIRRELFEPMPVDTILDDVLIPLRVVQRGHRVIFEPAARAHDVVSATPRDEFVRKTRTIGGTFQLIARESWMLNPLRSRIWFEALSHKALRLAIPALHLVLLGANLALLGTSIYRWAMAGQLLFYAAALAGHGVARAQRRSILLTVPHAMCLLGWATLVGCARVVTRRQTVTWDRAGHPAATTATAQVRRTSDQGPRTKHRGLFYDPPATTTLDSVALPSKSDVSTSAG